MTLPRFLLLLSALVLMSFTVVHAADRSSYGGATLTIKEVRELQDGQVRIEFETIPETLYSCPGVKAKKTDEGIELTFVRAMVRKKKQAKVDFEAQRVSENSIARTVTIPANGKPVFLRDGRKLAKIAPQRDE